MGFCMPSIFSSTFKMYTLRSIFFKRNNLEYASKILVYSIENLHLKVGLVVERKEHDL